MIKKILFALLLLIGSNAFSQAVINRAGAANTVQDARLSALYNLVIPRYADTTAANVQKGIDSLGAVIFTYDLNVTWQRVKNIFGTKQWERQARFSDIISATGWSKLGDAGTVLGTNFLGTTDNIPFQIRTSNIQSALLNQLNGNTGFGYSTLTAITSGTNNLALGYRTGTNITSGINNIVIGTQIDAVSATGSNTLNIGNTIYGDLSNDFIGIGVTAPAQALHVNGNVRFSGALMPGNDAGISGYALISQGAGTAPIWSLVTGSGTVTNFSSGNLSPLFTTSVATSTSTPALTFTLTDATGGTVFGRSASTTGAPSYTSTPVLGIAGTTAGTLGFAGNTSGVITIQTQAAAGTYNFNLPTTAGTTGYFLTSAGGAGSPMTWTAAGTGGLGTVTDFSAGTLSPLFTTSVANSTTTPALTFALTDATGGTVFGRVAGTTGAPSYTSVPVLGIAGTTAGTIGLSGATSGVVTLKTANAAGTWDLTFPTSGGTNGYILTTNGAGITSWTAPGSGGIGTVTSVSSGNFSPLFTVAVNNPTTTPAFVFTASNAAAGTLFGNNTGSAAAAAFTAAPVLGLAGTTAGSIGLSGVTSGLVTVKTADAAGTWTFKFPTSGGTSGYMLTTDGNGTTSWTNPSAGGTVTSFVFTDANGFDGTVTNATTTPTLSLTTTVSNTQVFYSNSGAVAGISGVTSDGTNMTAGSGNLRATRPQITTSLDDVNGNELFIFTATASSVNELTFANAATGNNPRFTSSGGDANVGIDFLTKATGVINFIGNSTQAAQIRLFEDTDDGSNYTSFKSPTLTANVNYTLPTDDGDANEILTSNGSGVLSWEVAGAGTVTLFTFTDGSGFDGTVINANTTPTLSLTTQLTTGSIPFIAAGGALSQENTNLFYDATNDRVGIKTNSPAYTLDVAGNVNVAFGSAYIGTGTGINRSYKVVANSLADQTAVVAYAPATGTNASTIFHVMPVGTGSASNARSGMMLFKTDYIADAPNYEGFFLLTEASQYSIKSQKDGTGSYQPILIDAGGTVNQLYLKTDGNVGIANAAPGELLTLGTAGTTKGVISFAGNTSGKVIVQPAAAAGSWTLTLPTTDGDNLQVLQTNGSGVTTWATVTSGTVTDFIFTDANGFDGTVTTSTTTPTLSLTTTAADTRLMFSASGAISSSASLVFVAPQLTVGAAGSTTGILALTGATSGTISIKGQAAAGTYNFNLPTTAGTAGQVLTSQAGGATAMTWTTPSTVATSVPISGLTAAIAANSIDNANYRQAWSWNTLNGNVPALHLTSASTTASDNNQTILQVNLSGANANATQDSYGVKIENTHTGTASTNYGLYAYASQGTNNIAAWFARGSVNIGTAGTESGIIKIDGSTSGTITFQPQAVAGTYNMNWPTTAGTAGQVLTSQAGGATAMTWTTPTTGTVTSFAFTDANGFDGTVSTATTTPTLSLTTTVSNTQVVYSNSGAIVGSANLTFDGSLVSVTAAGLGVTQSTTKGLTIINTTAAAAGAQQISPALILEGRGWKTDATAASQSVLFRQYAVPIQGAAEPTGYWRLDAGVNGSYKMVFGIGDEGEIYASGSAGSANQILYSNGSGNSAFWGAAPTGTVTSFAFTDGNGFDGTVSTATTTPTLSLTTTVSTTQVMYSNAGALAGMSGVTSDGTNMTAGSGNFRATRPRITTSLDDANGNELFIFTATGSAINELTYANAATGVSPKFTATGGDTNVGIDFFTKGGGVVRFGVDGGSEVGAFELTSIGTVNIVSEVQDIGITTLAGDVLITAAVDFNLSAISGANFQINGANIFSLTSTYAGLGQAGVTKGVLKFNGNTSGTVTMQPAAAAGTWNFTLPTTDGNSGEVLTTDGLGVTSWAAAGTGSNWALLGNAGTTAGTNFVGTTDNIDLVLKRGGVEAIRVYGADEKVGINTAAPGFQLEVRNDASLNFAVVNAFGSGGSAVIGLFTATDYSTGGVIQYNNASTAGTNPGNIASNLLFNASGAGGISLYSQHASGSINFSVGAASSTADNRLTLTTAGLIPYANDGLILGSTTKQWSDLFLAEGGVINWDNGDMTLTQVGNLLTVAGGNVTAPNIYALTQSLTDGATVTMDMSLGSNAYVTLAGNRTLAVTNISDGMYGTIVVTQDATGSRTLTLPATSKVANGGAGVITLSTTASAVDVISFYYRNSIFYWNYGTNYN